MGEINRILVIDDDEGVRDNFAAVLCESEQLDTGLDDLAAALFDDSTTETASSDVSEAPIRFNVDFARDGHEGLRKVQESIEQDRPYAVIFCDMRMPGMDGLECIEAVRKFEKRAQVIFVTAYSDHSVETIVSRVGADVAYFHKPFAHEELTQLATKSVIDWNKARELEALMNALLSMRGEKEDLERLLAHLMRELCRLLGTDSAALVQVSGSSWKHRIATGKFEDLSLITKTLEKVPTTRNANWEDDDGNLVIPIVEFGYAIAIRGSGRLPPDRKYLVELFLTHASVAINNSEIRVKLAESQRMSSIGMAAGQILHDMRSPIGTARMLLRLLENNLYGNYDRETLFAMVYDHLDRAVGLTEDIMEFSKNAVTLDRTVTNLSSLLERELEIWRIKFGERDITLESEIENGVEANIDVQRVLRVVDNLLRNAADALADQPERCIRLSLNRSEQEARLCIADNGPGIPESIRKELFRPFVTAGKSHGTGFGLAIADKLVAAHGGTIKVETDSHGTEFIVSIPIG